MKTQELWEMLREVTEALKDIINSADNGNPYDARELWIEFLPIYNRAQELLDSEEVLTCVIAAYLQ
jgi:hypothetical protein